MEKDLVASDSNTDKDSVVSLTSGFCNSVEQREIKFRAWHTKQDEWWQFTIDEIIDGGNKNEIQRHGELLKNRTQYTGLKDKNGKEIYEGDIIRKVPAEWVSKTDDSISIEDYLKSISNIGMVEYSVCGFHLTNKNYVDKLYDGYGHGSIEVIGNIFENPELL